MSEQSEKRCLKCHKRLINEKGPYCYRCRLEGLHTAGKAGAIVGGVALAVATTFLSTIPGDNSEDSGGVQSDGNYYIKIGKGISPI